MHNKEKLPMLVEEFQKFLITENEETFCKNVSMMLGAFAGNKSFKVSIVPSSTNMKEPFFGMRIFPDRSWADRITRCAVTPKELVSLKRMCERWEQISSWEVEMDARMFDRNVINFNPEELTAMLLHEIGHVVYSDRRMERFWRAYVENRVRLSEEDKAGAKVVYMLYVIPLTLACGFRNWNISSNDLREEVFADESVKKLGFAEHLISAYKKIIAAYGNSSHMSSAQMDKEIEKSVIWCNLNAKDLIHRKNHLKDELFSTGITTSSKYIRSLVGDIMDKFKIREKKRYEGNVVLESMTKLNFDDPNLPHKSELNYDIKGFAAVESNWNSQRESAKNKIAQEAFGKRKMEIPSQLDVDTLFVEVDRIENHADRRYVLDLIYHQEEKIIHFMELCELNEALERKYKGKMQSMLRELQNMRNAVLAKRSFEKEYKVFVKCPVGYEG